MIGHVIDHVLFEFIAEKNIWVYQNGGLFKCPRSLKHGETK